MRALATILLACAASGALAQSTQPSPAQRAADDSRQEQREAEEERRQDREARKDDPRRRGKPAFELVWRAPDRLRGLFQKFLPAPRVEEGRRRQAVIRPWIRDIRRRVPEIAAAEGYFSATVDIAFEGEDRERAVVTVDPGPRTTVAETQIEFAGDLAGEGEEREARRRKLRESWAMKQGEPFRSAEWEEAKTRLQESLTEVDYAVGRIADSQAVVDAESAKANLKVVLDSGPRFTYGDIKVIGLENYSPHLVKRMVDLREDERYSRQRLADLQRQIQSGPWFSSVVVDIERDPAQAKEAAITVSVIERPRREVGLAIGYGTDDGARAEAAFRHRDLFDRGFDLQSSIRYGEKRQIGYADVYLPPGLFGLPHFGQTPFRDSFGVLAEHSHIENLRIKRFAVAGYRHFTLEEWELRAGLSYQVERSFPEGSSEREKRALAPVAAVTWRTVDDLFDPKRGGVLNLQVAVASESIASSQDFLKIYGQYQHWFSITPRDQILLRTELGYTLAESREGIPEDFLYRAGGARSNRGYSYQGLGVREGNAIVGGRYIATATAEYVHWLNDTWGAALFTDVGDAADTRSDWQTNVSYGIGARYKTPAGPFALDLAYADREQRFRLSFSVTVAF